MATVKLTSKVFANAPYNTQWAAKETAIIDPQYLPDVYNVYGDLTKNKLSLVYDLAKKVMKVPNATINHFEKYAPKFAVTLLEDISTGSAGADITFKIETTDYDSNNKAPIRATDSIEIPYTYMPSGVNEDRLYRISSVSGSGNDLTFTASPFANAGTYVTASQISTAVPAGTVLRIGHVTKAPGTGQPDPKSDSWATREHVAAILAESGEYEGGQIAQAFRQAIMVDMKNGGRGILMDPILEVGQRLDDQIESYILTGERNDNTSITETSQAGSYSASVKSGFGVMRWADQLAQESYHTGSFSMSDLYRKKMLLQSQGVAAKKVYIWAGPEYINQFEMAGLEHLQQYSSTDILSAAKTVGVNFNAYLIGNIEYYPMQLDCFADPTSLGINVGDSYTYAYPELGLYVPAVENQVKLDGKKFSCPNIMIGYVDNNGEDRTRMVGIRAGVNGVNQIIPTQFVADQYDRFNVWMKTEVMVICVNVNQWILDRKSK